MGDVIEFRTREARQDRNLKEHAIEHPAAFRSEDPLVDALLTATQRPQRIRLEDIDGDAVHQAVEQQGGVFVTHDVSDSEVMKKAHGAHADAPAYHKVVGRWMSINRSRLGLSIVTYRTPRGARWQKTG